MSNRRGTEAQEGARASHASPQNGLEKKEVGNHLESHVELFGGSKYVKTRFEITQKICQIILSSIIAFNVTAGKNSFARKKPMVETASMGME